jgi:predicted small lipoprotein YifL
MISTSGTGYGNGGPTRGPSRPLKPLRNSAAVALSSLFAFGCVFLGGFKKQRVSLLTVALLAGVLTGCGGSGHAFQPPVSTPPGTYMLTVQSQHGSLVHSKQIELIVR